MTKTISVSKKMLAMFLAMLMMFSCMAVSASAAVSVPKPTLTKDDVNKTIAVTVPVVEGYDVEILFEPTASFIKGEDGNRVYINLTPGKTYTVKAYVAENGELKYSEAATATIKEQQATPAAPVPVEVTSTSIKIAAVTGCEYKINDGAWGSDVLFKDLVPENSYEIYIRKKATDQKLASEAAKVTIITLKTADALAADVPVLADKTNTTITVKEVKGVQFSIDKGATWQSSGEFKGLKADTIYGVIARNVYDPAEQDPNPASEPLEVKTNTKSRFAASPNKCTFTLADGEVYANKEIKVTVKGDAPASSYEPEYGDTKLIPDSVYIDGVKAAELDRSGSVYVGYIVPGEGNANKKITVTVKYKVEYFDGGKWVAATDKVAESKHEIQVGAVKNALTTAGGFFEAIANFFLNTLPQFILDLFGSDTFGKIFDGIGNIVGDLGIVK
ncbi:MAG: hypothetical protein IJE74_05270 [Clostridia bacterium]|nr:hypothetical protein [Clostridia bacterium]